MILRKSICFFISVFCIFTTFFHPLSIVKASVNTVPSDYRENAQNYAYKYWNTITDDGKYAVWLGEGTKFKRFISGQDVQIKSNFSFNGNYDYTEDFREVAYNALNQITINALNDNNVSKYDWINGDKFDNPIILPTSYGEDKFKSPDAIISDDANDCAHFVSNCIGINGGGIPLDSQYSYAYGQTSAEKLAKWIISNNYAKVYYDFYSQKPEIGDVIIWKKGAGRHTTIVISDDGELAYHTPESYGDETYDTFPYKSGLQVAYFFHFIPEQGEYPPEDPPEDPPENDYLPNLVATKYSCYPTNDEQNRKTIEEKSSFTINLRIDNLGNKVAQTSHVAFYLSTDDSFNQNEDFYADKQEVRRLESGEYVWIKSQFNFPNLDDSYFTGNYNTWIFFKVDCDLEVKESNESNTYYSNPITVYDSQDTPPPEDPPDEDKLSDLISPSFSWSPESATEGYTFTIKALIKNIGESSANSSYTTIYLSTDNDFDISDDYKLIKKSVPSLAPNEEMWIEHTFTFPSINMLSGFSPSYEVWLICFVDSNSTVNESDEDNFWKCNKSITVYE